MKPLRLVFSFFLVQFFAIHSAQAQENWTFWKKLRPELPILYKARQLGPQSPRQFQYKSTDGLEWWFQLIPQSDHVSRGYEDLGVKQIHFNNTAQGWAGVDISPGLEDSLVLFQRYYESKEREWGPQFAWKGRNPPKLITWWFLSGGSYNSVSYTCKITNQSSTEYIIDHPHLIGHNGKHRFFNGGIEKKLSPGESVLFEVDTDFLAMDIGICSIHDVKSETEAMPKERLQFLLANMGYTLLKYSDLRDYPIYTYTRVHDSSAANELVLTQYFTQGKGKGFKPWPHGKVTFRADRAEKASISLFDGEWVILLEGSDVAILGDGTSRRRMGFTAGDSNYEKDQIVSAINEWLKTSGSTAQIR